MPYIKKEFIDNLLEDVQIIDIVSEYTQLQKKGIHLFGLSPFSKEKSASFYIDQRKQRFYCKSSDKTGNAVSFLMQKNNMSYPEAIEAIAKIYNRPVQYADEKQAQAYAKKAEKKNKLRPILEAALEHYKAEFKKQPENHPAKLEVIGKRKYTKEIILDWEIGYAPGGTFLLDKLKAANLLTEALEISLVGDKYDKYWERIIYPIHDINGLLIGFAGRDISGKESSAKWINPAESIIYHKEKTWFGLQKALRSIIETGEANIVEGYNDVIAWHENGLTNSVAPCGTAITETQIKILKKYCKRINFTFDDDKPGKKAMLRYIPLFLAEGFVVNLQKTGGLDPDDFVRKHEQELKNQTKIFSGIKSLKKDDDFMMNALRFVNDGDTIREIKESNLSPEKYALQKVLQELGEKADGFKILLQEHLQGNEIAKSKGARKLCEIIATLEDEALKVIYIPWLKKESNISVAELRKWVKHFESKLEEEAKEKAKSNQYLDYHGATADDDYTLPDAVTKKWEEVKNDVYQYGLFESDHRMWTKTGSEGDYTFKHITNCSIEILQHMSDEEFPMKLFKIKNVYKLEKIFDAPSEAADSQQRFSTILSNNGNFMFTGDSREFMKLKVYLNDKMGIGRKIEVLGHQPEGFWAWNNLIQLYDGSKIDIDSNGLFIHKDVSYYIPSANKIYANNPYKYDSQKKFKVQDAKVTFKTFASKAMEVHREFAISGILFGIASLFQDIVVDELNNFPILFLYGPAGTGKDQISELVQSFYGVPQQAQNLEGGASTIKAKIIKLSQFFNGMAEFSEYKRGDDKTDGILKGVWDRNGYERGNLTSKIGLERVPVLSSLILTGNDYPGQEALITRLFANEINKNEFSEQESKRFEEFKDMCSNGYSSYSVEILKEREYFKANFQHKYRSFKNSFKEQVPDVIERMIGNASVLGATYEIFKNKLDFPFTFNDMEKHFKISIEKQTRKLASESIINKWWDCFLYGIKSPENVRIIYKEDFKLEGRSISFHFNQVYAKMAQLWTIIYKHEAIPGKTFLKDKIKSSDGFVKYWDKGLKMASGRDVKTSSGYEMDLSKSGVYDEIFDATDYQWQKIKDSKGQKNVFSTATDDDDDLIYVEPPATPTQKESSKEEIREISDLQNTIVSEDED
jgi:DNA primase